MTDEALELTKQDGVPVLVPPLNPLYVTPVRIDSEIVLMRYKHPTTGAKEYWTNVLGEPVDAQRSYHWKRASEAVDSAKAQLPEIRKRVETRRAAILAEQQANTVTLDQIKAETGDVGPQPETPELDAVSA